MTDIDVAIDPFIKDTILTGSFGHVFMMAIFSVFVHLDNLWIVCYFLLMSKVKPSKRTNASHALGSNDLNSQTRPSQIQIRSLNEGELPIDLLSIDIDRTNQTITLTVKDGVSLLATDITGVDMAALRADYPS